MKIEKFKLLLYLKKGSCDKSGKIPIMGRITVNRSMLEKPTQTAPLPPNQTDPSRTI